MFDGDQPLVPTPVVTTSTKVGGVLQRFASRMAGSRLLSLGTKGAITGLQDSFSRATTTSSHTNQFWDAITREAEDSQPASAGPSKEKAAIEVVRDTSSPAFYSLLFVVPKASGQWRPIIDLSTLNTYVDIPTFRMDTLDRIKPCLTPGSWAMSLDLQDAYLQIPIHVSHRKFLRFSCNRIVYQFQHFRSAYQLLHGSSQP